jgi:hypothetical protein
MEATSPVSLSIALAISCSLMTTICTVLFEVLNLGLRVGKPFQLRDSTAITLALGATPAARQYQNRRIPSIFPTISRFNRSSCVAGSL